MDRKEEEVEGVLIEGFFEPVRDGWFAPMSLLIGRRVPGLKMTLRHRDFAFLGKQNLEGFMLPRPPFASAPLAKTNIFMIVIDSLSSQQKN